MNRTGSSHARRSVFAIVILAALLGGSRAQSSSLDSESDPVRAWNELALSTVRVKAASDAQAARLYAMVNVAMYDAVNGIVSRHGAHKGRDFVLVPPKKAPPHGNLCRAAAAAAHAVLAGEYPDQKAVYDAQLQNDLALCDDGGHGSPAQEWGAYVGAQVRAARVDDGSTPTETQPGGTAPGEFRALWSGVQFRNLKPFGIADSAVYVGSGPPALSSLDYAGAFAEVKLIGNAAIPDEDKFETFTFWSLGSGTSQPPGAWIQVALGITAEDPLSLPERTRLLALVSIVMSDTVAPTFMTKFIYHHWRPATAIIEAKTDDNPRTKPDPSWAPRAGSIGSSPEYWSGHSSFSAAAAAALAAFFCNDNISFSLVTDSAPNGEARTYSSFSAAAAEAGRSRVVGGIHFEFSNQEGLTAGRAVAAEIVANKLLKRHGPTHFGQCPL